MKNVILYCRVCVYDKAELENQESILRDFCNKNGLNVVTCVQDVCSSNQTDRPQLTKVYNDCIDGTTHIDQVLCASWDRLSRNVEAIITYMQKFGSVGVSINALEEGFPL